MPTQYPTLEEAIELHRVLLERYGGAAGIRDLGLLESALYRPQTGYYDSLSMQAAALMQSLAQNHPFVDGNKRVAFALTAIFLGMNGYRVVAEADDAEEFILEQLIGGRASLEQVDAWLSAHMKAR